MNLYRGYYKNQSRLQIINSATQNRNVCKLKQHNSKKKKFRSDLFLRHYPTTAGASQLSFLNGLKILFYPVVVPTHWAKKYHVITIFNN